MTRQTLWQNFIDMPDNLIIDAISGETLLQLAMLADSIHEGDKKEYEKESDGKTSEEQQEIIAKLYLDIINSGYYLFLAEHPSDQKRKQFNDKDGELSAKFRSNIQSTIYNLFFNKSFKENMSKLIDKETKAIVGNIIEFRIKSVANAEQLLKEVANPVANKIKKSLLNLIFYGYVLGVAESYFRTEQL